MNKISIILFYICALCCAWEWSIDNQGMAIWLAFVAMSNLFYAFLERIINDGFLFLVRFYYSGRRYFFVDVVDERKVIKCNS